jgi:polyhydroxyalkanoate synthesis regulator phasin
MKKRLIVFVLFAFASMNVFLLAQHNERKKEEFEKFKEKRIAFITKAMDLNADEAKAFWPLCNELQEKKFELNKQLRKILSDFAHDEKEGKTPIESEYKEIVNLCAQFRVKEAKLDEEYILKFTQVIPYEKIYRYQQAELQFARQMLGQRQDRKDDGPKQSGKNN